MMKYKIKNLIQAALDGDVNIIAHQANCFNLMGAGVAGAIRKAFPEAAIADFVTKKGDPRKHGEFSKATVDGLTIYNLYGQYQPGRSTKYTYLESALDKMVFDLSSSGPEEVRIGIPKLGCGIAGGDWGVISEIIEKTLVNFDYTVFVLDESEIP